MPTRAEQRELAGTGTGVPEGDLVVRDHGYVPGRRGGRMLVCPEEVARRDVLPALPRDSASSFDPPGHAVPLP